MSLNPKFRAIRLKSELSCYFGLWRLFFQARSVAAQATIAWSHPALRPRGPSFGIAQKKQKASYQFSPLA